MDPFLNDLIRAFFVPAMADPARCAVARELMALQAFIVDDSIGFRNESTEDSGRLYILLAESPHTCEVRHQHPMAGDTGKEVSRALGEKFGIDSAENLPALGALLSRPCIEEPWRCFGIMNVSRLPLQKTAYCKNGYTNTSSSVECLFRSFQTLRNDMRVKPKERKNCIVGKIQQAILDDLHGRLQDISSRNIRSSVHIVPCGQVAQDAIDHVQLPSALHKVSVVPHPARNQWRHARNLSSWLDQLAQT